MTVNELLLYLTRRQVKDTFAAARKIPADKLDWKPAPGARSVLDQLQEFATAVTWNWKVYTERKVEWSEEIFKNWVAQRSQFTDIDEMERMALADVDKLEEFLAGMTDEDFKAPVELPFPGEYNMSDVVAYHFWNGAYHEGQINYIGSLLQ